jgi:hypothetical protein
MIQRLEAAQAQYDAAEAAAEDFELIASLGKALQALQQESAQLPLSEEDYLTLVGRRAQLALRIEKKGKDLQKAKDFAGLEQLGVHLEALQSVALPEPRVVATRSPKAASMLGGFLGLGAGKALVAASKADQDRLLSTCAELRAVCDLVVLQASQAPQRAEMIHRLEAAHGQCDAAEAAAEDFQLIASLGKALQALRQESAQLPLSEEDYHSLPVRHAQLVQRMTDKCKELMKAKLFDDLVALSRERLVLRDLALPQVAKKGILLAIRSCGNCLMPQ